MKPEDLAHSVVLLVKSAIAPLLERLSGVEARVSVLGDVRDRVVALETKQSLVVAPDLSPLDDVRGRVVALEGKSAAPVSDGVLQALSARVAAIEGVGADVTSLRDRVVAFEAKSGQPCTCCRELGDIKATNETLRKTLDDLSTKFGDMRERVAVAEARAPIPGPPGAPGRDGVNGSDGKDGLGFDDIVATQDGDRDVVLKGIRGDRVKDLGRFTFKVQINRGVYQEGRKYQEGDVVSWGGGQWYCGEETVSKPEEGSKAWKLVVKRGRDGRDGKDAPGALPVVRAGA